MRVIKLWTFKIGPKPPFSEWPALVHQFLDKHGLISGAFLYYFEDVLVPNSSSNSLYPEYSNLIPSRDEQIASSMCRRALKLCPSLGEPRLVPGNLYGGCEHLIQSNIDTGGGCSEAELLPLLKRIPKRNGYATSVIYYYDVDFFGDRIPWERDLSVAQRVSEMHSQPLEPRLRMEYQPKGSGIMLERHSWGEQTITFSLDLLHNGVVLDPSPYVETMKELLPNRHAREDLFILFSENDKREHAARQEAAKPLADACQEWLDQRLPAEEDSKPSKVLFPEYKVAPKLKALAKKHGCEYCFIDNCVFNLTWRTAQGHFLLLCADSVPSHSRIDFYLVFQGLGFSHQFRGATFHPQNQAELNTCAEQMASITAAFAEEALPPLSAHYPETPEWFQYN